MDYLVKLLKSGVSVSSTLLGRVVTFIIIAKSLGPEEFGKLSFVYALCSIMGIILDYGYSVSLLKDGVRKLKEFGGISINLIVVKVFFYTVLTLLLIVCAFIYSDIAVSLVFVVWTSIALISFANLFSTFLRGNGSHGIDGLNSLFSNVAGVIYCLSLEPNSASISFANTFLFISIIYFSLTVLVFHFVFHYKVIIEGFSWIKVRNEFKVNFFFAVDSMVQRGFTFIDVIILGFFVNSTMLGIYQAGQKIMQGLLPGAIVISNVFLPLLSNYAGIKRRKFSLLVIALSCVVGVALALSLYFMQAFIVRNFFGEQYIALERVLYLFSIIVLLKYISSGIALIVISLGKQRARFFCNVISIFIFVIISPLLSQNYGMIGMIYSLIINSTIMLSLYCIIIFRFKMRL